MKFVREVREGTPLLRLCDDVGGYHYNHNYYSSNSWVDEDHIVLARSRELFEWKKTEFVLVDLKNETETLIIDDATKADVNVYGEYLYYIRGLEVVRYTIATGEKKVIMQAKDHGATDEWWISSIHMTTDGRYISLQNYPSSCGNIHMFVINTETFETEVFTLPPFSPPHWHITHVMICPTNKDRIFFCHEGATQYISNRLWLWENGKDNRPLVRQRLDEQGNLADCLGHECWCPDGNGLYYVKYPVFGKEPYGIGYVSLDGELTTPDVRYSKYRYWHVCVSPDGKKLASDTLDGPSGVCVIDLETGEEKRYLHAGDIRSHPTHPHPAFSPSSKRLYFQDYRPNKPGEEAMLGVGIIDL